MSQPPNATAQTGDFEFAALQEARNYRAALLGDFSPFLAGRVLEVGAGIGQITGELVKLPGITRLVSLEPDPRFFGKLRADHPGVEALQGTVEELPGAETWNAILNINVLEHIEDDDRELRNYARLLSVQQGCLCLFVPARPEIYAPIDRDFGHFRRYTRPELRRKLAAAGFEIVHLRYFNAAGYFAWWLNFCVLRKRGFDIGSVRFFDRVIFPAVHTAESRVCAPPFGQSLMAVARAK
jgi:SAM-dependent methyltransferase